MHPGETSELGPISGVKLVDGANLTLIGTWGALNCRRTASLYVKLVEWEEKWNASEHPQSVLPQNWCGTMTNRTVTCRALKKATNNGKDEERFESLYFSEYVVLRLIEPF
ncbi:hypothetical protein TNCV_4920591 [Trichonephila clavipes]|nr:hypothetical protein TNCV_4920591 [Trichonephila clavipes]